MWEWVNATHAAGCDVSVLYDAGLESPSTLRNPAVPTIALAHAGWGGRFRVPTELGGALRRDDVLVLHSVYLPGNIAAAMVARRHGVPYIVMPHGGYNEQARDRRYHRKQMWQPLERSYLEKALAVHVFFEGETRDAGQVAPRARWVVAPTGFELPAGRWDGGTGGYLAWIGRYDIQTKGLDLLVEALTHLPAEDRRPLRMHGKPSEDRPEDVDSIATALGLADQVTVGRFLLESAKETFLSRAAAYVHPSRWESHSLALVEALAYGIPSVVSTFCTIAPDVRAADAAVIVEPTPRDIARGISTVLQRPREYSDRAIQFVRTRLTWSAIAGDYLRQIESLRGRRVG
jgi:glycosyltransferase involved in cell wall biosynthesis